MSGLFFAGRVNNYASNQLFKSFLSLLPVFGFISGCCETPDLRASLNIPIVTFESDAGEPTIQFPHVFKNRVCQFWCAMAFDLPSDFEEIHIDGRRRTLGLQTASGRSRAKEQNHRMSKLHVERVYQTTLSGVESPHRNSVIVAGHGNARVPILLCRPRVDTHLEKWFQLRFNGVRVFKSDDLLAEYSLAVIE